MLNQHREIKSKRPYYSMRNKIIFSFGFAFLGKQEPYFSITGSEYWAGKIVACGQMHDDLPVDLKPYTKWHLFSAFSGPTHYKANARFWLEYWYQTRLIGQYDQIKCKEEALQRFRQHVLFGELDTDINIPSLAELDEWLDKRLPALVEKFWCDMKVLGFDKDEVSQAWNERCLHGA